MVSMRAKIAEKILLHIPYEKTEDLDYEDCLEVADKILSLFPSLEGIMVVEECFICNLGVPLSDCGNCHGTGTITRQAEWGDIQIDKAYIAEIMIEQGSLVIPGTTKSGGRLKIK